MKGNAQKLQIEKSNSYIREIVGFRQLKCSFPHLRATELPKIFRFEGRDDILDKKQLIVDNVEV